MGSLFCSSKLKSSHTKYEDNSIVSASLKNRCFFKLIYTNENEINSTDTFFQQAPLFTCIDHL